jgi:hypothetical protein
MTDHMEIASLMQNVNMNKESTYRKVEYIQVSDQQGGQYPTGQFSFDLQQQKSHTSVLADSYLVIPLQIQNATQTSKYAIKSSLLSLIQGVQVSSSDGVNIVNEQTGATPIMANLRALIDSSLDFITCNELQFFGRDQNVESDPSGRNTSTVGGVNGQASSTGLPQIDPLHNPALASRISVFTGICTPPVAGGGAYTVNFIVYLPLRFIHNWFAVMDFPITNAPYKLTFNISGTTGYTAYCPFTCPTFAAKNSLGGIDVAAELPIRPNASASFASASAPTGAEVQAAIGLATAKCVYAAVAAADLPILAIVPQGSEMGFTTGVRLYLKVVTFNEAEGREITKRIEAGYRKTLVFTTSEYVRLLAPGDGTSFQTRIDSVLIGSSYVRPTRVWILPSEYGALAKANNTFPAAINNGGQYLTNTNILISGLQFYQSNLRSQYEFYKLLREQMIGGGSSMAFGAPITYADFKTGSGMYCFDISRNPTVDSNSQVALTLSTDIAVRTNPATGASIAVPPVQLNIIIERLNTYIMDVSRGGVTMTAMQGARI